MDWRLLEGLRSPHAGTDLLANDRGPALSAIRSKKAMNGSPRSSNWEGRAGAQKYLLGQIFGIGRIIDMSGERAITRPPGPLAEQFQCQCVTRPSRAEQGRM